ncbi:amidase [Curtobacterium sp. MCSS17_008]|uniref:AtzH-like domain-containing protein n=1 Tax=Curtobacterium sp. MCSS17_008 TaxID=2175647 RepID=UPI000DA7C41C|nr:AtzH-like domain-containing protein [Curtobacterium sp. MCSS17_008]PZF59741.1 amidase [Curtobacterium sp. MCSS17_008]
MSAGTPGEHPGTDALRPAPDGLLAALDAYERALATDDLAALDDAFVRSPGTLRGDDRGLLVGHDAISAFRGARGGVAPRRLTRVEVRTLADDLALVVSVSTFDAGGSGLQTQLWRREVGVWRIEAAHVTGRPRPLDTTVWRVVGDPLVPPTGSGPLDGTTVAVKDLYAVAGHRVGAGNPTFLRESQPADASAAAVRALLAAGASVRGIARTDEFAYALTGRNEHHGTPPNGVVPSALPGGSSSGSASAVRTGGADVGLGTDTAGSLRIPASYQGLWGLRTTHGLVDRAGLLPLAPSFDTVGWTTRDAETLLRALDASVPDGAGPGVLRADAGTPVVLAELLEAADPPTQEVFRAVVHDLDVVTLADLGLPALDDLRELLRLVQGAEATAVHGAWIAAHPGALGTVVGDRFAAAAANPPALVADAWARFDGVRSAVRTALAARVLVAPTAPGPAPALAADTAELERVRTATTAMTALASVGGVPSLSVPALTVDGAPVGLCLTGGAGTDRALVTVAERWMPDGVGVGLPAGAA